MEESAQRWLFALSAPMAALNGASYTAAEYYEGEDQSDLERWWGISNRAQLLDMLGMADTGHATEVSEALLAIPALPAQPVAGAARRAQPT